MFKPTITDMEDKYCGNCNDIYPIQSQDKGGGLRPPPQKRRRGQKETQRKPQKATGRRLLLPLNKVNIVAMTTILVFHVGNGLSEHV